MAQSSSLLLLHRYLAVIFTTHRLGPVSAVSGPALVPCCPGAKSAFSGPIFKSSLSWLLSTCLSHPISSHHPSEPNHSTNSPIPCRPTRRLCSELSSASPEVPTTSSLDCQSCAHPMEVLPDSLGCVRHPFWPLAIPPKVPPSQTTGTAPACPITAVSILRCHVWPVPPPPTGLCLSQKQDSSPPSTELGTELVLISGLLFVPPTPCLVLAESHSRGWVGSDESINQLPDGDSPTWVPASPSFTALPPPREVFLGSHPQGVSPSSPGSSPRQDGS